MCDKWKDPWTLIIDVVKLKTYKSAVSVRFFIRLTAKCLTLSREQTIPRFKFNWSKELAVERALLNLWKCSSVVWHSLRDSRRTESVWRVWHKSSMSLAANLSPQICIDPNIETSLWQHNFHNLYDFTITSFQLYYMFLSFT